MPTRTIDISTHRQSRMPAMTAELRKLAEIGGDGQDENFERAFSDLAHAYTREKAPSLEPYELGFEMLERTDDGERAAGITGFQVGDQLIYSPVFWLRGRIKGHELMFLKDQAMFVPMKENWLNYMMERKPQQIGESVARNPFALGIRAPDLRRSQRLSRKFAAFADLIEPGLEDRDAVVGAMRKRAARQPSQLLALIEAAGQAGVRAFHKIAQQAPQIAKYAEEFHGDALFAALDYAAQQRPATPRAVQKFAEDLAKTDEQVGMRVLRYSVALVGALPADLSKLDREKIVRDGFLIQDSRKTRQTSKAYRETMSATVFQPTETGLYDVITRYNGAQKCLVVRSPRRACGRNNTGYLVVNLEHDNQYVETSDNDVWAIQRYDDAEWQAFLRNLPSTDSIDAFDSDEVCLLGPTGTGTEPLRLGRITRDSDGQIGYSTYGGEVIIDDGPSRHFRHFDNKLFVPSKAKMVRCRYRDYDDPFQLGRASDLTTKLFAQMSKLAIFHDGNDVVLRLGERSAAPLTPGAALLQLVQHHGLREDAGRALLKQAAAKRRVDCFIKYASPYLNDVQQYGPVHTLPQDLDMHQMRSGEAVPVQFQEGVLSPVDMPQNPYRRPDEVHYLDGQSMELAQRAGETGQKDVFDAGVMTSMLRAMRDDQLIDRFVPALARAMDAAGRLLFQFYWHQEDFSERYGDRDMPELEDSLRNLFEGLGDIVLKLKQKTVDPYPEEQQLGVSLTDLAGAS